MYFQDVDTKETVWKLPEDGDVVVKDDEFQHNPMKRKSFRKIVDDEHGVYFQDVDTKETVWKLPEHGDVVVKDDELENSPMARKLFRKIVDDEHGVYFQDVDTKATVWKLPEDGDVVVEDDELQQNPMKKKGGGKVASVAAQVNVLTIALIMFCIVPAVSAATCANTDGTQLNAGTLCTCDGVIWGTTEAGWCESNGVDQNSGSVSV